MQLLGVSAALLLLISAAYGQDTVLATGLVANPFSTSAIIAFPSGCQYSFKQATIFINTTSSSYQNSYTFLTPQCRLKRDIVVVNSSASGNVNTVNVGFLIPNLNASTTYMAYYTINNVRFKEVTFTTKNGLTEIPPVVFARSGGMVVITVILSVAMFLLLVGLIVFLVLGARGKK